MKKISKRKLLEALAIDLPANKKALEYSALEENSHLLILSFSKVNERIMRRMYCRGLEVFRDWDDNQDFRIRMYIKNNLGGSYYFKPDDNVWRVVSQNDYFKFSVVLNIEDCEDEAFKYINKSIFNRFVFGGYPLDEFDSLCGFATDENIEYISKFGTKALLNIYLRTELNFNKEQFKFIVKNNLNYKQIELYLGNNIKNIEVLNKISECDMNYEDYKIIKKFLTDKKFIEYKNLNKRTANLYVDYLQMLEVNNLPINNKTLLPKQIKRKHDETVEIANRIKSEEKEKYFKRLDKTFVKPSEKFKEIETNHLKIVSLVNYDSFDLESQELKHCLRDSYFEKAAKGETIILAVRQKDKINKPFYTIEFKNGEVRQFYGKYNKNIAQSNKYKRELNEIKNALNELVV